MTALSDSDACRRTIRRRSAGSEKNRSSVSDGTPITFDRDYFGDHRGANALPGPFAKGAAERVVW